ncbi:MAG: flagellin FliC [Rhodobacteraceae bacterium]|nr:MAG: flagellin FliC [Paracoccaceae bacterium]
MSVINTNFAAIKARSNLDRIQRDMDSSIARLSSGKRITAAADDAAGSAIVGRMESQIRGLNMSIRTAKDGQSLVNTQEGSMQEIVAILQRMRELAVQSSSGGLASADKDYLHVEMTQLIAEVNEVAKNTRFNDMQVLTGTQFKFYHDIDVAGTSIDTVAASLTTVAIGITIAAVSIGSKGRAVSASIDKIDTALNTLAEKRANLGAVSNRFDHIVDNLTNVVANTETAKSRIEDADFAVETTQLTRNTVLQQAATSMITQANASKNTILALIQG